MFKMQNDATVKKPKILGSQTSQHFNFVIIFVKFMHT